MKVTKRNKIAGAVVVLAAGAFCVDRWMNGGGATEAHAASADRPSDGVRSPVTAVQPSQPGGSTSQGKSLAARLQEAAESEGVKNANVADAFRALPAWATGRPGQIAPAVDDFSGKYKLTAVMKGRAGTQNRGLAIINGKMVQVGESIDGFQLITVKEQSAVFRSPLGESELKLDAQ